MKSQCTGGSRSNIIVFTVPECGTYWTAPHFLFRLPTLTSVFQGAALGRRALAKGLGEERRSIMLFSRPFELLPEGRFLGWLLGRTCWLQGTAAIPSPRCRHNINIYILAFCCLLRASNVCSCCAIQNPVNLDQKTTSKPLQLSAYHGEQNLEPEDTRIKHHNRYENRSCSCSINVHQQTWYTSSQTFACKHENMWNCFNDLSCCSPYLSHTKLQVIINTHTRAR